MVLKLKKRTDPINDVIAVVNDPDTLKAQIKPLLLPNHFLFSTPAVSVAFNVKEKRFVAKRDVNNNNQSEFILCDTVIDNINDVEKVQAQLFKKIQLYEQVVMEVNSDPEEVIYFLNNGFISFKYSLSMDEMVSLRASKFGKDLKIKANSELMTKYSQYVISDFLQSIKNQNKTKPSLYDDLLGDPMIDNPEERNQIILSVLLAEMKQFQPNIMDDIFGLAKMINFGYSASIRESTDLITKILDQLSTILTNFLLITPDLEISTDFVTMLDNLYYLIDHLHIDMSAFKFDDIFDKVLTKRVLTFNHKFTPDILPEIKKYHVKSDLTFYLKNSSMVLDDDNYSFKSIHYVRDVVEAIIADGNTFITDKAGYKSFVSLRNMKKNAVLQIQSDLMPAGDKDFFQTKIDDLESDIEALNRLIAYVKVVPDISTYGEPLIFNYL